MSQDIWTSINPNTTSGTQLATILDGFKDAVVTSMSGTSRPAELQAGGMWLDTTDDATGYWYLTLYDGTNDIRVITVDKNAAIASSGNAVSVFEIVRSSDDTVGPICKLRKKRVTGTGQTEDGDLIGQVNFTGTDDTSSEALIAQIEVEATDTTTTSAKGGFMSFKVVDDASATLSELLRLVDGKVGIKTSDPESELHVVGSAKIDTAAANANATELEIRKKRIANNGQTLSGDTISKISAIGADEAGTDVQLASIEVSTTQDTTTTQHGSEIAIKRRKDGTIVDHTAMEIKEGSIELNDQANLNEGFYSADSKTASVDDLTVRGVLTANELQAGTVTEIEDPTITLNKGGNQSSADTNDSGFVVEMSDATNAAIGYDSTKTSKFSCGEVGSLKEIVTVDTAQTITNKTNDDELRLKHITTPSNPAAGYLKIYPKSDNKMYTLTSAGIETELGGGSSGGGIGKNWVINANMDVSQRGDFTSASAATNGSFTLDRWKSIVSGATANVQVLVTSGQNRLQHVATSTASGIIGITQKIEDYLSFTSKTITISVRVKSNSSNARVRFQSGDGSVISTAHTGGGGFETLTATVAVGTTPTEATISALLMDASGNAVSITSGDYVDVEWVKVEIGATNTDFIPDDFGTELRKCKRYYQKSYAYGTAVGTATSIDAYIFDQNGNSNSSYTMYATINYEVELRAAPSVVNTYSTSTGTAGQILTTGGDAASTLQSNGSKSVTYSVLGGASTSRIMRFHWVADAEL